MSHVRVFLFWLLAFALPLQGTAAAMHLSCASGQTRNFVQHGGGAVLAERAEGGAHACERMAAHTPEHACNVCMACGPAVATTPSTAELFGLAARADQSSEPQVVIPQRVTRLPEKPPRA